MTSGNLQKKKICAWLHALPIHQNLVYTDLPHTSFEQFLRAIWNAVFQAIALILSSKLNSQLIHLQCRGSGFNPWVQFLEKEMATHSSVLAWRIPWTEEPGRLQSMRFQKSDMTEQLNHPLNCAFFFFFFWLTVGSLDQQQHHRLEAC